MNCWLMPELHLCQKLSPASHESNPNRLAPPLRLPLKANVGSATCALPNANGKGLDNRQSCAYCASLQAQPSTIQADLLVRGSLGMEMRIRRSTYLRVLALICQDGKSRGDVTVSGTVPNINAGSRPERSRGPRIHHIHTKPACKSEAKQCKEALL